MSLIQDAYNELLRRPVVREERVFRIDASKAVGPMPDPSKRSHYDILMDEYRALADNANKPQISQK